MPQVILRREHIQAKTIEELEIEYAKQRDPLYKAIREQHPQYPINYVGARIVKNIDGSINQLKGWNGWTDLVTVFETGKPITVSF